MAMNLYRSRSFLQGASALLITLISSLGWSYYSNMDVAELLKQDSYQVMLEPQYIFDNYPGANVIAHFDWGANPDGNLKFLLGTGRTTFQGGAFYKLVPIPDMEGQPGIGFFGGVLYAYQGSTTALNIRLHPEISKKFKSVDAGEITPYGAVPFGVDFTGGNTYYPVQLAVGTRWLPPGAKHTNFWAEFGFELDSAAFSYISLGVSIPFSDTDSFKMD
jgi:hypothetical protein